MRLSTVKVRQNEEEKVMNDFYNKFQSYNHFTFKTRVFSKLITFSHSIKTNPNSPTNLKKDLEAKIAKNQLSISPYRQRLMT